MKYYMFLFLFSFLLSGVSFADDDLSAQKIVVIKVGEITYKARTPESVKLFEVNGEFFLEVTSYGLDSTPIYVNVVPEG